MDKVTIKRIVVQEKSKAGKEYKDKSGKQVYRVSIQVEQFPDLWFSSFAKEKSDKEATMKVGESYFLHLSQDGQFYNFRFPNRMDSIEARLVKVETALKIFAEKQGFTSDEVEEAVDLAEDMKERDGELPF